MDADKEKIRVLFLCTGNSCRSQMAEGWARHLKSDIIEVCSAGIWPVGLSSRAIEVMAEAGVDISAQKSQHVDDFLGIDFDYVITLCGNARECCPIFGGRAKIVHEPFEDPAMAVGSGEQIMAAFRRTRDQIRAFIETLPESLTTEARASNDRS
jgi:arsenate reductase